MEAKNKKVLVTVPEPLLKKLDASARKQGRNRSAELCMRLTGSLKNVKPVKAGVAA